MINIYAPRKCFTLDDAPRNLYNIKVNDSIDKQVTVFYIIVPDANTYNIL